MNPRNFETWFDLSTHPRYQGRQFDPTWYEGDVHQDLALLRELGGELSQAFPDAECELVVLDDSTTYVSVRLEDRERAVVYPATTESGKRGYFLEISDGESEIRLASAHEVIAFLKRSAGLGKPGRT